MADSELADAEDSRGRLRLDQLLVELGLETSRNRARQAILAGQVSVDGVPQLRPGVREAGSVRPVLLSAPCFVSRGGLKLAAALEQLGVDPSGLRCVDAGAGSGGFTDCLLQRGAHSVLALDVGHDQLAPALARDPRVRSFEGVNVRSFSPPDDCLPADLLVADLAFISLSKVWGALRALVRPQGRLLVLIKPQFELERTTVPRSGVVRDARLRQRAIGQALASGRACGLRLLGSCDCALPGTHGNREAFALFLRPAGD